MQVHLVVSKRRLDALYAQNSPPDRSNVEADSRADHANVEPVNRPARPFIIHARTVGKVRTATTNVYSRMCEKI